MHHARSRLPHALLAIAAASAALLVTASLGRARLTITPSHAAYATIVAGVADARSGAPLKAAEVILPELRRMALTDWMGEARLRNVPAGEYRIRVRKLGYAPSEVRVAVRGDSVGPVFFLEPVTPALDTVKVIAKRGPPPVPPGAPEAFGWRKQMGIGRFLTSEDLAQYGDQDFQTVLAGKVAGLRRTVSGLATARGACGGRRARGASSSCLGGSDCPVRILLDDMDVGGDVELVRTWDLAAIEFYSAASAPVQYRDSRSGCGVLLLWSKR